MLRFLKTSSRSLLGAALPFAIALAGCTEPLDAFPTPPADYDAGSGAPTDAGPKAAPDAGPVAPLLLLTASSSSVTAEGDETLKVTVEGAAAPSIEIDEGDRVVGTFAAAPYEKAVRYTYLENGAHTFTAKTTLANGRIVTSDPLTVTVDVPANGVFVDANKGSDSNPGTRELPYLTIYKAMLRMNGRGNAQGTPSIYLSPGTYDESRITKPYAFTYPTNVRGLGPGVVLVGAGADSRVTALELDQGGEVRDVSFRSFGNAILIRSATFRASGTSFDGVAMPFDFQGGTSTIDESGVAVPFLHPPANVDGTMFFADAYSTVTFLGGGGTYFGTPGSSGAALATQSSPTVTVHDFSFVGAGTAVAVRGTSAVALEDVSIVHGGCSGVCLADDVSAVAIGDANTDTSLWTAATNTTFSMKGGGITGTAGSGISVVLPVSTPASIAITLAGTHVDGSSGYGIYVPSQTSLDPSVTLAITAIDTSVDVNGVGGINAPFASIALSGGTVSANGGAGIHLLDGSRASSLQVRGTAFAANAGDFIDLAGSASSVLDLGTTASPGHVVFSAVPSGCSAVHIEAPITGSAVGDTWIPSAQGADASGEYTASTTLTSSGANATLGTGAKLVVR